MKFFQGIGGKEVPNRQGWTQCPEVANIPNGVYDIAMEQETEDGVGRPLSKK